MPTTRSRALRSNNASASEHAIAAHPTVPPPPERKKRKHSRAETENVASTDPGGENDATVSAVTAISAKKRKRNDKKPPPKRKATVKKPGMPPPPPPVTVKVVNPTPPEVSQKAMRSSGSVIEKFDPWKLRDSIPGDGIDELYDSGAIIENAAVYDESALIQSVHGASETEALVPHSGCGVDAMLGTTIQGTTNQHDDALEEAATRILEDAYDGLDSVNRAAGDDDLIKLDNGCTEDDDEAKSDSMKLPVVSEGISIQQKATAPYRVHSEENDLPHGSEPLLVQQERDAVVEVEPPSCPGLSDNQTEEVLNNSATFDELFPDTALPAAFQERSLSSGLFLSRLNEDTDAASSTYTEDAEGVFDEEFDDNVKFENPQGNTGRHDWEERRAAEELAKDGETGDDGDIETSAQDHAEEISASTRISGNFAKESESRIPLDGLDIRKEGAEFPAEYEDSLESTAAENKNGAMSRLRDRNIVASAYDDEDAHPKHAEAAGEQDSEQRASDIDEDIDQTSSVGDNSECGAPAIEQQVHGHESPGGYRRRVKEVEENSDDDMSNFFDDVDPERPTAQCEEAALAVLDISNASVREDGVLVVNLQGPEVTIPHTESEESREKTVGPDTDVNDKAMDKSLEPSSDETTYDSEMMEATDEDQLSSLFDSARKTPERDDLDMCGGSRGSAFPSSEAEPEHSIGAEYNYTAAIDDKSIGTSERGSEGDQESANDRAGCQAGGPNTAGQFTAYIASADVLPAEITQRSALLPPELTPRSSLPQGLEGVFNANPRVATSDITETNALLRGIYGRLTQILDIQQKESIENAKFRAFVTSRERSNPDLNVVR